MDNEYFGDATTPTEDFLAHYGVRGMKWGVRKAIAKGNMKALSKQYKKASKKLAKLDKQAANVSKYKKRAIGMGAGAALAGGLAAAGTSGVSTAMRATGRAARAGMKGVGNVMEGAGRALTDSRKHGAIGSALQSGGRAVRRAGSSVSTGVTGASHAVDEWGRATSISKKVHPNAAVSNNTLARIGAGAIGAGLAAGAARNAYKAKTAQKKAQQFRSEMNKAFAGTQYANGTQASQKKRKKNRS